MLNAKPACALVTVAVSSALGQVVNPGFEDPIPNGDPGNWVIERIDPMQPATGVRTDVMPRSGDWHMRMSAEGGSDPHTSGAFIYQGYIPVTAGTVYDFSLWARRESLVGSSTFAILSIYWSDDAMTFDGESINITPGLTDEYRRFSLIDAAPAGATRAQLAVEWRSIPNSGSNGVLDVDDVSFVPGPGGAALLSGVGIMALRRRRPARRVAPTNH